MNGARNLKRAVIASFFEDVDARVVFLEELARTGHKPEAMTLSLTYIDSFAQWLLWPATSTGRNVVEAVVTFGGDTLMPLAHPLQAARAFGAMKASWKDLASRIKKAFPGPSYELLTTAAFVDALRPGVTQSELDRLRGEIWRTTIANLTYQHLRNPSIHSFGGGSGIWLSNTTYQGAPVPPVDLQQLLACVRGLVREARRRSEESGQWFGDDAIVKDA